MKIQKVIICFTFFLLVHGNCFAQNLTQTVRGNVYDADNRMPLVGAQVIIRESEPLKGAVTDLKGAFRIENVPIGRINLDISYIGYQSLGISDVSVISGKETILNISLQESIHQGNEVVVSATKHKGEPIGEMAVASVRSISSEETNRYAGGFSDPARILSNFAGVNNSQDGSADIIVRGNSPKYLQWRLEGVQISSPNHFADPAGLGTNGISVLNNSLLSTSDFYTGAFPAEFGDALSGVYNIRLRNGNNEKLEGILGAGIVGTDLSLEGPFRSGYSGSFLVNYRFTTVAIVDKLGLMPDLGGIPDFQDGAFKLHLPSESSGTFSLYGLMGLSTIKFEDVNAGIWLTPGSNSMRDEIEEDFRKKAFLMNTGLNHFIHLGSNTYLQSSLAFSADGIADTVTEKLLSHEVENSQRENYRSRVRNQTYRANFSLNTKFSARNTLQIGTKYAYRNQQFDMSQLDSTGTDRVPLVDFEEGVASLQNFISVKHRFNPTFTLVGGLHNMNVLYNNKSTIEPRLALNWHATSNHAFNMGYGMHSTMESIHNYFAKVEDGNGNLIEPNRNLDLLKAHHLVLGYENRSIKNIRIKADLFYQHLYDLPVENDPSSHYSTINESLDIRFVDLVNEGTGFNYGIELTIERFFTNNWYLLANGTIFESKYKALDGIERNTAFNSNYLVNVLWGKEFPNLGKHQDRSFGINGKAFFGGGKRMIPLLRDANGGLAVNPANNHFYDFDRAYEHYLDDIYTITLSLNYKWSKANRTNELYLNIDNITHNRPRLSEYYDTSEPGNIGYLTPLGIFPNLMYRLYF